MFLRYRYLCLETAEWVQLGTSGLVVSQRPSDTSILDQRDLTKVCHVALVPQMSSALSLTRLPCFLSFDSLHVILDHRPFFKASCSTV
ncbi:hypothetical protein RHMOL_Rhmol11G0024900 [Rhododendron molle]|uniref:Uncharacterized protein n=1 Tax=Rhododendron molle TaxID=49168 RepID=A0ACC0LN53_RHOML|nr:hypothetical protein RHMOL_Rhmol11G0024900 [Rhododendron molle]